jgi:myo-inositol-1(or 4)-monophosphatase
MLDRVEPAAPSQHPEAALWAGTARDLVRRAGDVVREDFARAMFMPRERKAAADFVTATDKRVDAMLVESIRTVFPDHVVVAEESGLHDSSGAARWLVDPLDGTNNFIHMLPQFSILLAVQSRRHDHWRTEVGVVYDPMRGELFDAIRGGGVRLNGKPLWVSQTERVEDGLFASGFPSNRVELPTEETNHREYCAVNRVSHGVRRLGSAGLDLAYVAAGRFDGFWEARLGPWDVAAGGLMVEEAGGRFSTLTGEPVLFCDEWPLQVVVGTNGRFHDQLLEMVRAARSQLV